MFLLLPLALAIDSKYLSIVKQAKLRAARSVLSVGNRESPLDPGTYVRKEGKFSISQRITGSLANDIKGYGLDSEYLAIIPEKRKSIKSNEEYFNNTIFVDAEVQKMYKIEQQVDSDAEVSVFKISEVEPLTVINHFKLSMNTLSTSDQVHINEEKEIDVKWETNEGEDPYEDGRPITTPINDKFSLLQWGLGAHLGAGIQCDAEYYGLLEFFISAKFTFKATIGAMLKLAAYENDFNSTDINILQK